MTDKQTAVAWSMEAPSATGGKIWRVLVFDKYLVVGWGSTRGTMQYQVAVTDAANPRNNAAVTRANALTLTEGKEKRGYSLMLGPVTSHVGADIWEKTLPGYEKHRGASVFFDSAFRTLFTEGTHLVDKV